MQEKPPTNRMTADEYLKLEESSQVRHEFVDGELYAMTGSTKNHNRICFRMSAKLDSHLSGSPCQVFLHDLKVHVQTANCYYYPDVVAACEPYDGKSIFVEEPRLIIEVLSPSTQHIDRREKRLNYAKIGSLREYIVIHHNKRLIEIHRKESPGVWSSERLGNDDELVIKSLPGGTLRIGVADIYADLDVPLTVQESEEEYI